jgi:hypothetical protein
MPRVLFVGSRMVQVLMISGALLIMANVGRSNEEPQQSSSSTCMT